MAHPTQDTAQPLTPEQILDAWLERNLSEAIASMPRAYAVDGALEDALGILASARNLLLIGESGVGKSALVAELARRLPHTGGGGEGGDGALVMQLSVGLRLSRLRKDESLFEAFAALMDALPRLARPIIAYFRDGDLFQHSGLAAQLESFCLRQRAPVIIEGRPAAMHEMLETFEEIEHHFVTLALDEPDPAHTLAMLQGWCDDPHGGGARRYEARALEEAVYLTHRFLARSQLPRKALELLRASAGAAGGVVDAAAVIERFASVHRTPRWLIDPHAPMSLDALEERFRDALLGQPDAVDAAISTIAQIKAGLSDLRRPFGVFLFVGPTGVGKTHLAQLLAAELFGGAEHMVRLNMGDFSGPRGAEALFGDPEHHLPTNRRGVLTQRLMGRAFGVLLLDEFEKADPLVHERLLPLIDEGRFVNGASESVSCRSSIIIATSNAGAEVYRESALGFTTPGDLDSKREELERRVQHSFRFELLNRFDRVVYFQPLTREDIRELAVRELAALEQRPGMRRTGAQLHIDEAVLDWLAARGYDARYGARFLRRTIEREVTSALADAMSRHPPGNANRIALELRRGRIRARLESPTVPGTRAAPPATRLETMHAAAILDGARPRLDALARDVDERDRLLTEMAESEFWDDAPRRIDVIERFRTLDVTTRLLHRFARPIAHLDEILTTGGTASAEQLGAAAKALREWEARERMEGERSVWLLLSSVDNEFAPRQWLIRLARIFMAWCRLSELRCAPVAFEPRVGDAFSRLALEIEGPGAEHFLEAERGVHRLRRSGAPDAHVRVDLVAQGSDGYGVDVRDRALLRGPFAIMARLESTLSLDHTGQSITLAGASRVTLAALVGDLQAAWSGLRLDSPAIVRSYGEPGGLVLDPRTGASTPLRRVERGRLEAFRDAWRDPHGADAGPQ